jgi:hypothetical protein
MPEILTGAALLTTAFKPAPGRSGMRRSWTMDLTNVALLLIVIALIALIPCGCIFTRHGRSGSAAPSSHG